MWVNLWGWQMNLNWVATWLGPILAILGGVVVPITLWRWRNRREDRRRAETTTGILLGLREEIAHNFRDLKRLDLPERQEKDILALYDDRLLNPKVAWFKVQNNAVKRVISAGGASGIRSPELQRALMSLNASVEFVNQQVRELVDYRFSSPDLLAQASSRFRDYQKRTRLGELFEGIREGTGPPHSPHLLAWWQELAHRQWAIVNPGYHERLIPAFKRVETPLNEALKKAKLGELDLSWPERSEEVREGFPPTLSSGTMSRSVVTIPRPRDLGLSPDSHDEPLPTSTSGLSDA